VQGNGEIARLLTSYRDAIQYVHDEVVRGMNDGKDVFTLMQQIHIPERFDLGEGYGRLTWSVRGIYEGYAGWFDLNPATMYERPPSSVDSDLTALAGGPDALARLARERLESRRPVEALHLTNVALAAEPSHRNSLQARLQALEALKVQSHNVIERAWLDRDIAETKEKLGDTKASP
jgi:alkyl sulfatase BDS1-like metallo-beta-lactamase superfamily hydrolase